MRTLGGGVKNTKTTTPQTKIKDFGQLPFEGSLCALRALSPRRGDTSSEINNHLPRIMQRKKEPPEGGSF